ncbi:fluoride efflux transporter FluC [Botrimarina hoheduenensis]|uniref:Fluoride-specific ion channel FluC n=1 Tax=Botrimarina hoheduenensis TaxID=2528000 RepID=A0A5C5VWG5_9BACT|nr:CrcB family protein [Botrimarina hoheduenensis]TWT42720.1 putative fluoride ion transporter CrcB [Botrimarina hoheduenensis]
MDTALRLMMVALGGAIGATLRYTIGMACERSWGAGFGYGTLLVNVLGCFLLGALMHPSWIADVRFGPHGHAALTAGLLGGLTTFSTFGYQTLRHVELGQPGLALANVGLNVVLGLAAAAAGLAVAKGWS